MSTQPSWAIGTLRKTDDRPRDRKSPPRLDQIRTAAHSQARFVAVPPGNDVAGVPDAVGMLTGHAAVFDEWSEIASRGGNFMESIDPHAFDAIDPQAIRCLYAHGRDSFIGERPLGPIIDLRSDDHGLKYAVALLPTLASLELLPGLQAGLFGSSFRFSITREQYDPKPQRSAYNPAAIPERRVLQAVVYEVGPCCFPAYAGATAGASATAKPEPASALTLSGNSTASVAASREPRSTPPPSWALPTGKPARTNWLTKSA